MTGEDKEYINVQELNVGRQDGAGSSATNPTVAFGDGNTGFYENTDNQLYLSTGGSARWGFDAAFLGSTDTERSSLLNEDTTATNPNIVPIRSDEDTGIGSSASDELSLIAGAQEAFRLVEVSDKVIHSMRASANVGLTADASSVQGGGVIIASYNVYDTVETAGDAATLPAAFSLGTIINIKNGSAANSMDVFPALGDDLGQGANTQEALAAGDFAVYLATTSNNTWEKIGGGTA